MAGPGGNPEQPIDPAKMQERNVRALEHLTQVLEGLQNSLISQQAGQGVPQRESLKTQAWGPENAAKEQAERLAQERLAAQPPGRASPHASYIYGADEKPQGGPLLPLAAISPLQALKAMRNRAPGEGRIEGAFNIRKPQGGRQQNQGSGELSPNASNAGEAYDEERVRGQTNLGSSITKTGSRRGPRSSVIGNMSEQETEDMEREGFWIPQFGEWQLDTKLRMARDWAGLAALRHPESAVGKGLAGASELANYGYAQAAKIQVAKKTFQKLQAYGTGALEQGGELGYSPQGGIGPSNIAGFRNPLAYLTSAAGKQGLGMNLDAWKMARLGSGLSLTQSKEIYSSLANMGFSNQESGFLGLTTGGDLNNIANRFMAPLVKQGVKAEIAAPFTESLKTGQVSISELAEALQNLSDVAKHTHQTVSQAAQGIQEYTQTAVQMGGTPMQGIQAAKSFSNVTGLPSQVGSQSLSSPLLQAKAMARYGVLPENVGQLPGSLVSENIIDSMHELLPTLAANLPPIIDPATKEVVRSGEDQAYGILSNRFGIPVQQLKALHQNEKGVRTAGRLERFRESGHEYMGRIEGELKTNKDSPEALRQAESKLSGKHMERKRERLRQEYENREGKFGGWVSLSPEEAAKVRKGDWKHGIVGTDQIAKWMEREHFGSHKEIKEYEKAKVKDQQKIQERILGKWSEKHIAQTGEVSANGVTIGLTPYARKFFKLKGGGEEKAEERRAGMEPPTTTPASAGAPPQYGE